MSDMTVADYIAHLSQLQEEALIELSAMERPALRYATPNARWNTVRRVMLRLGDHLREHTTQLAAAREAVGSSQTMPQRLLARSMEAYGVLLGALVGLDEEHLDREPEPGEWTPRQVIEHLIDTQRLYLEMIRQGRHDAEPVERD